MIETTGSPSGRPWPVTVAIAAVVFGALIFVCQVPANLHHYLRTPMLLMLLAALWQGMAGVIAATVLLAGTLFDRARQRPLTIERTRAPRAIVAMIAGSLFVSFVVPFTLVSVTTFPVIALLAVGLGVFAAYDRHAPWRSRTALLALLAGIALFEIPRELNLIGLTLKDEYFSIESERDISTNCNDMGSDGELSITRAAHRATVVSRLRGNVGALVPSGTATHESGLLRVEIDGDVSVGWLDCLMPLHKTMLVAAELPYTAAVEGSDGSCWARGTIELRIVHAVNGFAACRDVREKLAAKVADKIEDLTRALVGPDAR